MIRRLGEKDGIPTHGYALSITKQTARREEGPTIIPIRVPDRLASEEISTDREMPSSDFASPQEIDVLGIRATAGRPTDVRLNFSTFVVVLQHDVDRPAKGVTTVDGPCTVGQNLNALDRQDGNGVEIRGRVAREG